MAEITQFEFSLEEVTKALVIKQGLHEGLWQLAVNFGFAATNVAGEDPKAELRPAAVVAIQKLLLTRCAERNALTIDAALINPVTPKVKKAPKD